MKFMYKLILVKHSLPEILPEIPASEWHLSAEGRLRCQALADELAGHGPDLIFSSSEPKAEETAQIIAQQLVNPLYIVPGLHEHERKTVRFTNEEQFKSSVKEFFEQPDAMVFGEETAAQSLNRFSSAVNQLLSQNRDQNLVVVSHGTVITLFVANNCGIEPFLFWSRLDLPSFVVLSIPDLVVLSITRTLHIPPFPPGYSALIP
jgi:broad specificity phosphatase PhoE